MATKSKDPSAKAERAAKRAASAKSAQAPAEVVEPAAGLGEIGRIAGRELDAAEAASVESTAAESVDSSADAQEKTKWLTDEAIALRYQDGRISWIDIHKAFPGRKEAVKNGTAALVSVEEYTAFRESWIVANPGKPTGFTFAKDAFGLWKSQGKRVLRTEAEVTRRLGKTSGITAEELQGLISLRVEELNAEKTARRAERGVENDGDPTDCHRCHRTFQPVRLPARRNGQDILHKDGSARLMGDFMSIVIKTGNGSVTEAVGLCASCRKALRDKAKEQNRDVDLRGHTREEAEAYAERQNARQRQDEEFLSSRPSGNRNRGSRNQSRGDGQMRDAFERAGKLR